MTLSWVRLELFLAQHSFDILKMLGNPLWASGSCCVSLLEKHKRLLSMPWDIRRNLRKLEKSFCLSGEMKSTSSPQPHVSYCSSALLVEVWLTVADFSRSLSLYSPASGLNDFSIAYSSVSFFSCIFFSSFILLSCCFQVILQLYYLSLTFHQLENETHRPIYILQTDLAFSWTV